MNLKNKVVAITGGARGLGLAMARSITDHGGCAALIDLNLSDGQLAAAELEGARAYAANVCDESQVDGVFEQIMEDFGSIDVLVNNAGVLMDGLLASRRQDSIKELALDKFKSVLDVNLTGTFLCGRAASRHMIKLGRGGLIVNISSISRAGNFGQSNYSASKAAVVALATTWAKELAKYNIRAAAIAPGFIATEMTDSMPPEVLAKIAETIPLGRMGTPEEIAAGLLFIIQNDYFNSRVLEIDGGLRI